MENSIKRHVLLHVMYDVDFSIFSCSSLAVDIFFFPKLPFQVSDRYLTVFTQSDTTDTTIDTVLFFSIQLTY